MFVKMVAAMGSAMGVMAFAGAAQAAAVVVPYSGSFNESSVAAQGGLPAGDYDTIGGAADVGLFQLVSGANTFAGGARSPSDSSDAFLIEILPGFTLVSASIRWATNANPNNPVFAVPAPNWSLEESDADPTIFQLSLGGNGATAPININAPAFTPRGPGIYSVILGNGVFGMNNGDPINYTMTFNVRQDQAVVPLPAALPLFLAGLGALGVARRRKKA